MRFDLYGEYKPCLTGNCTDCGLCSKVCPFVNGNPNEDDIGKARFAGVPGIRHTPETGYYLDSYVGYATDPKLRWSGASGGLLTSTLTGLLEQGLIDRAICVRPAMGPGRLFEFTVCRTTKEIRNCAKSCYYPVELSEVTSEMLKTDARYAVVGLPCALKALRLAEEVNSKLKERIAYHLGLVCGQQKSAFFAEYICSIGGGNPRHLKAVSFRVKDHSRPASDYGLGFTCSPNRSKESGRVVYWTEGMSQAWCKGWFKLNACNYCDDLFAEVADAAYMDAWLPQYAKDPLGTNLVLVRNQQVLELLKAQRDANHMAIDPIGVDDVIRSQRGALSAKRETLATRLALAQGRKQPAPQKRVTPVSRVSFRQNLNLRIQEGPERASKAGFRAQKVLGGGLLIFRLWMCMHLLPLMIVHSAVRYGSAATRRLIPLEGR